MKRNFPLGLFLFVALVVLPNLSVSVFYNEYLETKKFLFLFLGIFSGMFLLFQREWKLPSKWFCLGYGLIVFGRVAAGYKNLFWIQAINLADTASAILIFQFVLSTKSKLETFATPFFIFGSIIFLLRYLFVPDQFGSFGYQNLAMEYSGVLLLYYAHLIIKGTSSTVLKWVLILLCAGIVVIIGFSEVRAVAFSLMAIFVWLWFLFHKQIMRNLLFLVFVTVATLAFTWHVVSLPEMKRASPVKAGNVSIRLARWANTAAMIAELPLGLGVNSFSYGYLGNQRRIFEDTEVSEGVVADSPHNEFLGYGVESGWLGLIGFLTLVFAVAREIRSRRVDVWKNLHVQVIIYVFSLALFTFPLQNSVTLLFVLFSIAYMIDSQDVVVQKNYRFKAITLSAVVICAFALWETGRSSYRLRNYSDQKSIMATSCKDNPSYLETCLRSAQLEIDESEYAVAEVSLEKVLAIEPKYFPAIRLMAWLDFQAGRKLESCSRIRYYDGLFGGESHVKGEMQTYCQN